MRMYSYFGDTTLAALATRSAAAKSLTRTPKSNCRKRTQRAHGEERRRAFRREKSDRHSIFKIRPSFFTLSRGQLWFSPFTVVFILAFPLQLLRIAVGQRFEQHPIHHAEDGGVRPDAERERQHGHGGEAGILQHLAEG